MHCEKIFIDHYSLNHSMSGVTTHGKAAKAAQGAVPLTSANTPANPVPMDPKEAQAAEEARLERLAKQETIKQAWQKGNNMIFRGSWKDD